jgi:hypothetical protein
VRLHFADGAFACGTATAIGARGMLIEAVRESTRAGCVDVRLVAPCGQTGGECSIRLPSIIMCRSGNRIRLLFRRLDGQARKAVQGLVAAGPTDATIGLAERRG